MSKHRPGTRGAKMRAIKEMLKRESELRMRVSQQFDMLESKDKEIQRLLESIPCLLPVDARFPQHGHKAPNFDPEPQLKIDIGKPIDFQVEVIDLEAVRVDLRVTDGKTVDQTTFTISGYQVRTLQERGVDHYPVVELMMRDLHRQALAHGILAKLRPRTLTPEERWEQRRREYESMSYGRHPIAEKWRR